MVSKIKNGILKFFIYPFIYGKGKNDYNAENYWKDRFSKYKDNLKSVGNEGLSEKSNEELYEKAKVELANMLQPIFSGNNKIKEVLEIGPGLGVFTKMLYAKFAKNFNLSCYDITDFYFESLLKNMPEIQFTKKDVSVESIPQQFDAILMLDVIEHIVKPDKFAYALNSISKSLNKDGYFVISGFFEDNSKKSILFHFRYWSKQNILDNLLGKFDIVECKPFRDNNIMILQKKA